MCYQSHVERPCVCFIASIQKTEFTTAQWQEFDGEYLHIPAERTKSRRPISLYIQPLPDQFPQRNDSDFIFTVDGRVPTRMDDKLLKSGCIWSKQVWLHDNRHTFSSHMNDRQNADFVAIEACLNHVLRPRRDCMYITTQHMQKDLVCYATVV